MNISETLSYLKQMTDYLIKKYKNKTLDVEKEGLVPFEEFNESNSKTQNISITTTFAKQLITLYRMSGDKAKAIVDKYPTPSLLIDTYETLSEEERYGLLEELACGETGRKLGSQLSKFISELYSAEDYDHFRYKED